MPDLGRAICALLVPALIRKVYTAPAGTFPTSERAGPKTWGETFIMNGVRRLWFTKGVYWYMGIAEALSITASAYPNSEIAKQLLTVFWFGGNVDNIRNTWFSKIGIALLMSGTFIRWRCYQALQRLFTFEVSIRKNHELIKTGPYAIVRHPSYSGMVLAFAGGACWYLTRGSWLRESGVLNTTAGSIFFSLLALDQAAVLLSLLGRMSVEDKELRNTFGKEWEDWARDVPYALFPGLY